MEINDSSESYMTYDSVCILSLKDLKVKRLCAVSDSGQPVKQLVD